MSYSLNYKQNDYYVSKMIMMLQLKTFTSNFKFFQIILCIYAMEIAHIYILV